MKNYPALLKGDPKDVDLILRYINQERPRDIEAYKNLDNRFMSGRRVGRVPSDSDDVIEGDKIDDFNIIDDGGTIYYYTLALLSGSPKWVRFAFGTF